MREIKFRLWDKFQCKYVFEGFHVFGEITCFDGMEAVIRDTWKERSEKFSYKSTLDAWGDFYLQQYTGLKDKNGKEIYEGDIISDEKGFERIVKFEGCGFCAVSNHARESMFKSLWMGSITFTDDKWEVTGNIYENPELLK